MGSKVDTDQASKSLACWLQPLKNRINSSLSPCLSSAPTSHSPACQGLLSGPQAGGTTPAPDHSNKLLLAPTACHWLAHPPHSSVSAGEQVSLGSLPSLRGGPEWGSTNAPKGCNKPETRGVVEGLGLL